jgi:predicted transglutaminase-like cysteine proteinase
MRRLAGILAAAMVAATGAAMANDRSGSLPSPREGIGRPGAQRLAPLATPRSGGASVPIGWVNFCADPAHAGDCAVAPAPARNVVMNRAAWRVVERVNRNVNAAVAPVSDRDNYGVEERWAYPVQGRGDCEDYVLLKRRLLIEAGFPRQSLLITVVREANGDGHAVLTLTTTSGDWVLDNKRQAVRRWSATGYAFIKRQSQEDPNHWVDLRVDAPALAAR